MDRLRGTEKNAISRDSKSESARSTHRKILQSTQIKEWIPSPLCIYQNVNEVPKAPNIPQTFPVHKVIRHMSKNVTVYLQFFYLASDEKLFFTQYHQQEGDPEISVQEGMDVKDECHSAKCREAENGSDWLCCPLCGICFHKDSFYVQPNILCILFNVHVGYIEVSRFLSFRYVPIYMPLDFQCIFSNECQQQAHH